MLRCVEVIDCNSFLESALLKRAIIKLALNSKLAALIAFYLTLTVDAMPARQDPKSSHHMTRKLVLTNIYF